MPQPFHCLMVGQRPSDLVEIADTASALAARGHQVTLFYLYASPEADAHRGAFEMIDRLEGDRIPGLTTWVIDVLSVQAGIFDQGRSLRALVDEWRLRPVRRNADTPVAPGLLPKVFRRLRDPKGTLQVVTEAGPAMVHLGRRVPAAMWSSLFTTARRMLDATSIYRRFRSFFSRAIAELKIDAVVIPEDIVGPVWPVLINASHAAGIPALVCPYTLANQSEAIQSLKAEPAFQASVNAIAHHLHPEWRYRNGDVDIVRLPAEHILAHAELGITPPDPWMMNSGFSDQILVDSQASFDYFRDGGIPPQQMSVVGSVSLDRMARLRRDRAQHLSTLASDLGLRGSKPLLLISGCPDQLSAKVPYCEFTTMDALAQSIGAAVQPLAADYHLVVRPHPNFEAFAAMLEPFGVIRATAPTASLVPLADLFVAFASATIRWAIACGVPTINYDVFNYGYGDFTGANGVAAVNTSDAFARLIQSLTPGSPALAALRDHAARDSARWGVMDGRGLERIEGAIEAAMSRRRDLSRGQLQHA
jgi:hypothetical protein